jgi:biopolymer transport protein ExbD
VVLVALIVARILPRSQSQGLKVGVIKTHCRCAECYQDDSGRPAMVWLRLNGDGSLVRNGEPIVLGQVASQLDSIYRTRMPVVRQLFLDIDDSVSYQQAVTVIDAAQSSPGVEVLLITPSTREACRKAEKFRIPPWPSTR